MRAIGALALAFARTTLREGNTLFWFWLFPLLLFGLLGGIFGRVERGRLDLTVVVVNLDRGPLGQEVLRALEEAGLALRSLVPPLGTSAAPLLAEARREVAEGRAHAALIVPEVFSDRLLGGGGKESLPVEIFYRRGEAGSSTAASLLAEVLEEFGRALLAQAGLVRAPVDLGVQRVGGGAQTVGYAEFLLPGVLLMALFVLGLFGVPDVVLLARETGVLRRYFAAPLSGGRYLLGVGLGLALVAAAQTAAVWALGRMAFGVRLPLGRPASLAFLLLAFATALALGFLIAALARNSSNALALANLLNLPLQFLGGLYFPLTGLPAALRPLVAANPLTHLAEGWRMALGLGTPTFPLWLNLLVPLLWIVGSGALAAARLTFLEDR
ncbi:MAG: ABC transporter permease [Candidatus Bipolaricaulota bacterium]|nr:ABC transporter permease [Candidatus Bipolaricaulota bacterium]